jgi:hypothetical protein
MKTSEPGSFYSFNPSVLVLATGIANHCRKPLLEQRAAVTASGIFFINILGDNGTDL